MGITCELVRSTGSWAAPPTPRPAEAESAWGGGCSVYTAQLQQCWPNPPWDPPILGLSAQAPNPGSLEFEDFSELPTPISFQSTRLFPKKGPQNGPKSLQIALPPPSALLVGWELSTGVCLDSFTQAEAVAGHGGREERKARGVYSPPSPLQNFGLAMTPLLSLRPHAAGTHSPSYGLCWRL